MGSIEGDSSPNRKKRTVMVESVKESISEGMINEEDEDSEYHSSDSDDKTQP